MKQLQHILVTVKIKDKYWKYIYNELFHSVYFKLTNKIENYLFNQLFNKIISPIGAEFLLKIKKKK